MKLTFHTAGSGFSRAAICLLLGVCVVVVAGCETQSATDDEVTTIAAPHIVANSAVEAGRYLAIVGQCNDCHTDRYLETDGQIPEEDWFAGTNLGWRGPWGTTYPANLRLRVQELTEDEWVNTLHTRTALPPMPWMNVNQISDQDARALYQYLRSLGPAGSHSPVAVPPDQEPTTPYLSLVPQNVEVAQSAE
ncbi:MAG: hypothetical protein R3284_05940 [Rubricoccaceae bacterium]|nr:hypothetical protein [Rubricoccaceae bacterium]